MKIKIALAGNPNCGKTTLFNALTGSNQYVGNWSGVTVEKKEGKLKKHDDVVVTDLPGIYSLSPYTLEEVVARNYLIQERPEAILNIVDGTNLERNLYLTTQLMELGIPVIVAINMMDVVRKNGDKINVQELSRELGCEVMEISALKGDGIQKAAEAAIAAAKSGKPVPQHNFSGTVEHALAHIEEAAVHNLPEEQQRWYAVKIFERDDKVLEQLNLDKRVLEHIEKDITAVENEMDDDAESIITNERYIYIGQLMKGCYKKKNVGALTISDKIDKIVTNRILALPIFIVIMWLVYTLSIGTIGDWTVVFMNDGLFGSFAECAEAGDLPAFMSSWPSIPELLDLVLLNAEGTPVIAEWLYSLIQDGIVGGVGAVLGFVPQMLILFLLLSILEDCGYMSRVAFIMDRIFRKFGLSGKSFIPMLVATGCGVPGVMASRTIEQDRDRKMTIMTTCFMPCGAKMPIVGLIASALFGGSALIATFAYFIGVAAVIVSGVILKKTKAFAGDPAPFVMELPAYHAPVAGNIFRATWERGWSFIKRAGTVIVAASVIVWVLNSLSFEGGFHYITEDLGGASIHAQKSGVSHFRCDSEKECYENVRKLLDYIPHYFGDKIEPDEKFKFDEKKAAKKINQILPENPRQGYDVREVINCVIDEDSFLEIMKEFAINCVVGFGKIEGRTVGIVANNPKGLGGVLDCDASDKIARFIRYCDSFDIPLLTFVDVPGFIPGPQEEQKGIIRHGAKVIYAYSEATVPKLTVIIRKAIGGAYIAMCSKHLGADFVYAWPSAEIAVMGAEGAIEILYAKELKDPNNAQMIAEKTEQYKKEIMNPKIAAERAYITEVINPEDTRKRIVASFDFLETKIFTNKPLKKHGNIPL